MKLITGKEEIKEEVEQKEVTPPKKMNLKQRVEMMSKHFEELEGKKKKKKGPKKFRLPYKAKLNKTKLKKGYITIVRIDDNKNVEFVREPIDGATYRMADTDTVHALKDKDVFSYRGKPLIIQATKKINPFNPLDGANETYGQRYIMARMISDRIKSKNKIGGSVVFWIIAGCIGLYVISQYLG